MRPESQEYIKYPVAFILSSNDRRRHMTKGARAMIAARICLLNKQTVREAEKQAGVSNAYVAKASVVLEYTPELADSVIAGKRPFNDA